jgi:hypothetical protein
LEAGYTEEQRAGRKEQGKDLKDARLLARRNREAALKRKSVEDTLASGRVTPEQLVQLYDPKNPQTVELLSEQPKLPRRLIVKMYNDFKDSSSEIAYNILANLALKPLPDNIRKALAQSTDPEIQKNMIRSAYSTEEDLKEILPRINNPEVARAALRSTEYTPEQKATLGMSEYGGILKEYIEYLRTVL